MPMEEVWMEWKQRSEILYQCRGKTQHPTLIAGCPQSWNVISYVSFMVFTDANPAVYRGRPGTNGVGWLSCWEVSLSPQSPITHRDNASKHQGAPSVLYLNILWFMISLCFFSLTSEKVSCNKCNNIGLLALKRRSISSVELKSAQLEETLRDWRKKLKGRWCGVSV